MPFTIVRDDITRQHTDAIVNAANEQLLRGGGVCGAIFAAADGPRLQRACQRIGRCPTGGAVLTESYGLPAPYIIHAVGPVWRGGGQGEEQLLRHCYRSALGLAQDKGLTSVSFPLISSGIYGYPKAEALRVATEEISAFLLAHEDMEVRLVVFDQQAFDIGEARFSAIAAYIDQNYVDAHRSQRQIWETGALPKLAPAPRKSGQSFRASQAVPELRQEGLHQPERPANTPPVCIGFCPHCGSPLQSGAVFCQACGARITPIPEETEASVASRALFGGVPCAAAQQEELTGLQDRLRHLDDSFSVYLLHLIDRAGKTDAQVYKKANIDRKLFSKIRKPDYQPSKVTALALAIALELSIDDTADLLARAGYALSPSSKFDLIVSYFIEQGNFNIFEINEALFRFEQHLLGA